MTITVASHAATTAELHRCLRQAGFSHDDCQVYLTLLQYRSPGYQRLVKATRLSIDAVQMALAKLKAMYLVIEMGEAGQRRYCVTDPWNAWNALVLDQCWRSASTPLSVNPNYRLESETKRHKLLRHIAGLAAETFASDKRSVEKFQKVFDHEDEFAVACSNAFSEAKVSVVAAERPPRLPHVALFWPAIVDLREKGVNYTRYAPICEVFSHGIEIVHRDCEGLGIDLRIVPRDAIRTSLFMFDDNRLFLFGNDGPANNFRGRLSRNPAMINRYRKEKLAAMERQAIRYAAVKDAIQNHMDAQLRRLRSAESIALFTKIRDLGKFCFLDDADRALARNLVDRGFLDVVGDGFAASPRGHPQLENLT